MLPGSEIPVHRSSELQFDKLVEADQQDGSELRKAFGHFVVREAVIDEEYWVSVGRNRWPTSMFVLLLRR